MNCAGRCLVLCVVLAVFVTPAAGQTRAQPKKAPASLVVETTEKAGKWGVWAAKKGAKILTDRDYALSVLPREMIGGTFVARSSGEYGRWLPDGALKAKTEVTVYAIVRVKYLGKDTFDEVQQGLFAKDGWEDVDSKVGTTFPTGKGWEWKAFKKDVDEGEIYLPLKELSWDKHGTGVLFLFKRREKPKP